LDFLNLNKNLGIGKSTDMITYRDIVDKVWTNGGYNKNVSEVDNLSGHRICLQL